MQLLQLLSLSLCLVTLLFSIGSSQGTCPAKPMNYEKELKKCLFQDYDKSVRPADDLETITTTVHLHLRYIHLDEHVSSLKIHAWASWAWTDNNLKWNPSDYGNAHYITVMSDELWQPDVSLMTTDDASMHLGFPSTWCRVSNVGRVHCYPPTTFVALCSPQLQRWPFDTQTCTAVMGSWTQLASKLNLTLGEEGVSMDMLLPNPMWAVEKCSARREQSTLPNSAYPTLVFTFSLRRHAAADAATAVAPAFVMAATTLASLLLEPGCTERLALAASNALAHVLYLQYMSWRLPPNGDSVPALVIFLRDSLALVGVALAVGVATRRLTTARSPPPACLRSAVAAALATAPGQLLLLGRLSPQGAASAAAAAASGDDGATLVAEDGGGTTGGGGWRQPAAEAGLDGGAEDSAWRLAAVALDRISLALFCLALSALFVRYVV